MKDLLSEQIQIYNEKIDVIEGACIGVIIGFVILVASFVYMVC